MVMDRLTDEVRRESPWTMMFADDFVFCSESRARVEENLEKWKYALEQRRMKVTYSKTEYGEAAGNRDGWTGSHMSIS